jgi:hypothetical protein
MAVNVIGYVLGWMFTESDTKLNISRYPMTNHKPLNCRPCFTFWAIFILQLVVAIVINSNIYWELGLVFAFMTFISLKYGFEDVDK